MHQDIFVEPLKKSVNEEAANEAQMALLAIVGMRCPNCVTRVHNRLLSLEGVVSADIDLERGLAFVDYVPAKTNPQALVLAVSGAGDADRHNYRAVVISTEQIWRTYG